MFGEYVFLYGPSFPFSNVQLNDDLLLKAMSATRRQLQHAAVASVTAARSLLWAAGLSVIPSLFQEIYPALIILHIRN